MKVWNTSATPIEYRGKTIPPGSGLEFNMDFVPNRDLKLQSDRVLFFGEALPLWYVLQTSARSAPKPTTLTPAPAEVPTPEVVAPAEKKIKR